MRQARCLWMGVEMETEIAALLEAAEDALAHAHAPYSRLQVGAAVRTARGGVYAGCNVENAAYPLGSCAETGALAAAVLAEGPELEITDVVIAARNGSGQRVEISPCGGCRQRILEFGADVRVHCVIAGDAVRSSGIAELLPDGFRFESPGEDAPGN